MEILSKIRMTGMALAVAVLAAPAAHATTWDLIGVTDVGGGQISGWFTTDANGAPTAWDIVETGSVNTQSNTTYDSSVFPAVYSYSSSSFDIADAPGNNNLYLAFDTPLTLADPTATVATVLPTVQPTGLGGPTSILYDTYGDAIAINTGIALAPEPASMALLGFGLTSFGLLRRRRRS